MATKLTQRCSVCKCMISQDEADQARDLTWQQGLGTLCLDCADSFTAGDVDNDASCDPE